MPRPRTVVDLLAEQPEAELKRMREDRRSEMGRLQAELVRVTLETEQIEQALAKLGRENGPQRITAEMVLEAARKIEPPFTAAEVREAFKTGEHVPSINAIRNHLNRLTERRELGRNDEGQFFVTAPQIAPAPDFAGADDDIPF